MRRILHGQGASRGLELGRARVRHPHALTLSEEKIPAKQIDSEVARLDSALLSVRNELHGLRSQLDDVLVQKIGEFLDLHVLILDDPELRQGIEDLIRTARYSADYALKLQRDRLAQIFTSMDNEYFRTRLDDLDHVVGRVHAALHRRTDDVALGLGAEVLVATDVAPAELAVLKQQGLKAIVTVAGSPLSHNAIIARSLHLPMVVGVSEAIPNINDGDALIVDGRDGQLIVEPNANDLERYHLLREKIERKRVKLEKLRSAATRTADGIDIALLANGESREEIADARACKVDGIGLYRSEFLFMRGTILPDEEDQFVAYRDAIIGMGGRPVTIRTLDLGADKADRAGLALRNEANPALGLRGVRLSLARPELLDTQLSAILRASAFGPVRILVPMITCRDELVQVRMRLDNIREKLSDKRVPIGEKIEFGAMIEVPAAAFGIGRFADLIDFASIGTNDLVQYLLATDRTHEALVDLYSERDPAVLALLHELFAFGQRSKIPISICGEMAANVENVPILLALGLRNFSVHSGVVLEIRDAIRHADYGKLRRRAASLLRARDRSEVARWISGLSAQVKRRRSPNS